MIGLEIDLKKLLGAGRTLLVTGTSQFVLCVGLGIGLAFLMGFTPGRGNFDWLYLAVTLALSSTLIVVKLLYDKFELTTLPGRITLGVLVCQDIWASRFSRTTQPLRFPHLGTLSSLGRQGCRAGAHDLGLEPIHAAAFVFFRRQGPGAHVNHRVSLVFFGERRSLLPSGFPARWAH
jgi:hypothetical protein